MPRKRGRARAEIAAATMAALLAASCGPARRPDREPPRLGTGLLRGEQLTGRWHWHRAGDARVGRVVEAEDWVLEADDGALTGTIHRRVTVISSDGQPFACSQSLTYTLEAFYELRGSVASGQVALRETNVKVLPSPCESGLRRLGSYSGTIDRDGLVLEHGAGQQTLYRTDAPTLDPPEAPSFEGAWRWTNRHHDVESDQVRIEREEWQLTQTGGSLIGHYDRHVTVFSESGRPLSCGTGSTYQLHDRYAVRGHARGSRLEIIEIGADPSPHPCDGGKKRRLDAARGRLEGNQIVLEWRGRRRQILSRGGTPPAERD